MASEIERRIPHRAPFLFVDAIESEDTEHITTSWTPTPDADFFRGHYPGNPIVPGVLIMEMVFQSAALHFAGRALQEGLDLSATQPVLTRVNGGKFKRMAAPGEKLTAELTLTEALGPARFMKARVKNEASQLVTSLEFAVAAAAAPSQEEPQV